MCNFLHSTTIYVLFESVSCLVVTATNVPHSAMNTKHSEPFYISASLFDNRRLKRRLGKWMERQQQQQQQQQLYMAHTQTQTHAQTERGRRRRCHLMLSRRHVAATLPADITIDLLSDEEEQEEQQENNGFPSHSNNNSLQLSTVPNITLVPVELSSSSACASTSTSAMLRLMPRSKRCSNLGKHCDSIVLTSDDEDVRNVRNDFNRRSPPPLAPLTFSSDAMAAAAEKEKEEVTVSLVPRHTTTANCQARRQRRRPTPRDVNPNSCLNYAGYLSVDVDVNVASDVTMATLPDETTVHTVIANRIYELSLSKLREGLASSGVPEYAHDMLPEQLQKLSPAMRAKVAPMVAATPPAPISLKLSSDLSISLISDDDDCESGNGNNNNNNSGHNNSGNNAHAAAKLLKQQQPQLSVVQHLQYPGHGTPVSLPVMAALATERRAPTLLPSTRRRKLG
ncbi:hypothetical protein ACLKA6_016772 [Drosophila palustris]